MFVQNVNKINLEKIEWENVMRWKQTKLPLEYKIWNVFKHLIEPPISYLIWCLFCSTYLELSDVILIYLSIKEKCYSAFNINIECYLYQWYVRLIFFYIFLYFRISSYIFLYFRISFYIFLYFLISSYIFLYLSFFLWII